MRISDWSSDLCSSDLGTVTLRARFPKPGGLLLPGMFVTALFEQAVEPDAILVPQQAVQRDFDGSAFVYLVGKDDKVARRKVVTTRTAGTDWVVSSGLAAGDRVITQGTGNRSEEHTSELQSLMRMSYAVLRVKKKK